MPRGMVSHHCLVPLLLPPGRHSEALGFLLVLVLSLSCSEEQGNDSKSAISPCGGAALILCLQKFMVTAATL